MRNKVLLDWWLSGGSSFSAEMQAVIAKANSDGAVKPTTAVLQAYDTYLITPLKNSVTLPWSGWISLHQQGLGSIEFGSINLVNPATKQHTFPVQPTFQQPQDASGPFGIKSNVGNGYVNTHLVMNEFAGAELTRTTGAHVSESSTVADARSLYGSRGQAATSNTSLIVNPLISGAAGQRFRYAATDNFTNTNHKGWYVMTYNGTQNVIYKDGVKDLQVATPTAPDLANDILWLARNQSTTGTVSPTNFYTGAFSDVFFAYNGQWTDAMELEFRTIYNNFLTKVVEAFFFSLNPGVTIASLGGGQSNWQGHAETNRLFLTPYTSLSPVRNMIFYKPNRTSTDNGSWDQLNLGVNNNIYSVDVNNTGMEYSLGPLIAARTGKKMWWIKCGQDGTSLHTDWNEATPGSLFTVMTQYYFDVALPRLINNLPPGETIKFIMQWDQGEEDADAVNAPLYKGRLETFMSAWRAYNPLFATAPLFLYSITPTNAFRIIINTALAEYASENQNTYYIDGTDMPAKQDLTVEQKGGQTPTSADDGHESYLVHKVKGERTYDKLVEIGYI